MLNKKICLKVITVFCIIAFLNLSIVYAKKKVEKCESCNNLVESFVKVITLSLCLSNSFKINFFQNLEKTAKGNFGGGNTGLLFYKRFL